MKSIFHGYEFGDAVFILGTKVSGFVISVHYHLRKEASYIVEYVDASGNPQEREWSESQLNINDPAPAVSQPSPEPTNSCHESDLQDENVVRLHA